MQKIRTGLAGFGMSAQAFHLPSWRADARFEVVRVSECSGDKAQAILPQMQTVRLFEKLLTDDVDLVVITTSNQTHFDFAAQVSRAGRNVVAERPSCVAAAQVLELVELTERQGVSLTVYQNRCWDSMPSIAKKLLSDDLSGEIVDAEFRFECYAAALNKKH